MRSRRSPGFTFTELVAVLAISAIAATLALPAMTEALARYRLRAAADSLLDTLRHARSVALWRDVDVRVCPGREGFECAPAVDWTAGWTARGFNEGKEGNILVSAPPMPGHLRVIRPSGRHEIHFTRRGAAYGTNQRIVLCVASRPATALAVVVGNAGLAHRHPVRPHEAAACAAAPARQH
ncbi:prepilin-type N-terminal cleavage/methylation domain-containing protein [Luteibacter jiangsuensis]|uniref:Type II secretion system protein H n=1 Tax=Luteibacter jiangsuensis TaxID=637577 RepID=A0ABX0Q809_9GAMM|nr:GspH/FimT family pseudopilin [Luteibacter jiangsuensis]NID06669.1 prepilin-type N-terminal cleavage/methylation domain-containing protein [Luteibacter jiangsuensis]